MLPLGEDRNAGLFQLLLGLAAAVAFAAQAAELPSPAAAPGALKAIICGPHACRLEHVARLSSGPDVPTTDVLRWNLCGKAEEAWLQQEPSLDVVWPTVLIGRCARAYYRVAWPVDGRPEVKLLTIDSNAGPNGYGTGAGGESVAVLPDGRLEHEIEGGSSSRWRIVKTWALQPRTQLVSEVQFGMRYGLFQSESEWRWDTTEGVKRYRSTENACEFDVKGKRWTLPQWDDSHDVKAVEAASGADMPTLTRQQHFDWHVDPLPDWLELRADASPGRRRYSIVVTHAPAPASEVALRLLRLPDGSMVVEWLGMDAALEAQQSPRLELWWSAWTGNEFGRCVLPPRARIRAFSADGDKSGLPLSAYQVLIQPDGKVQPAYGRPQDAGRRIEVERARVDGHLRWRLRWRSPYAKQEGDERYELPRSYAVALSLMVDGRQHLVSHAELRHGDPSSFIEAQGLDPTVDEQWREALRAVARAKANEKAAASSKSERRP